MIGIVYKYSNVPALSALLDYQDLYEQVRSRVVETLWERESLLANKKLFPHYVNIYMQERTKTREVGLQLHATTSSR